MSISSTAVGLFAPDVKCHDGGEVWQRQRLQWCSKDTDHRVSMHSSVYSVYALRTEETHMIYLLGDWIYEWIQLVSNGSRVPTVSLAHLRAPGLYLLSEVHSSHILSRASLCKLKESLLLR